MPSVPPRKLLNGELWSLLADLEKAGSTGSEKPNFYLSQLSAKSVLFSATSLPKLTKHYQTLPNFKKFTKFYKRITKVYQISPKHYQMWDLGSFVAIQNCFNLRVFSTKSVPAKSQG